MDDPALQPDLHRQALSGLARLNFCSAAARPIWRVIERHCRQTGLRSARLLDVASGAGDVPLSLSRSAAAKGIELLVSGCDRSSLAVTRAQRRAAMQGAPARFLRCDVLQDALPGEPDIITCSLFLHHLTTAQVVDLLGRMRDAARRLLIVSDLERSRWGYALAWLAARALTRSPVVHRDAPQSVAAAFSREELQHLAERAGLEGAELRRVWPFRLLLSWRRQL